MRPSFLVDVTVDTLDRRYRVEGRGGGGGGGERENFCHENFSMGKILPQSLKMMRHTFPS